MNAGSQVTSVDLWHNSLWSRYKGGVFTALYEMAPKFGFDINIFQISISDSQRSGLSGIDMRYHDYKHVLVFDGNYDAVPKLKMISTLFSNVWRSKSSIVILASYSEVEYWCQMVAARLRGKKVCVFSDSTLFDRPQPIWKHILKRLFFWQCDLVFCYGERSTQFLLSHGVPPDRIHVRYQAAALPIGYCASETLGRRLRMAPSNAAAHFLYVGRLSHEKGLDVLLSAFVKTKSRLAGATLTLVGAGPDKADLQAQARSLGLTDSDVIFAGSKEGDALFDHYLHATALVLPSWSEPWGLVVNEALSCGCPVVVSDRCGCVPELVVDGLTGFSFRAGDVDGLSRALFEVIEVAAAPGTAEACIAHIAEFSPSTSAQQIIAGLQAVRTRH